MSTAPMLRLPNFSLPFVIEAEACASGMGAVLMQDGHLIAYLSRSFSPKNLALSVYEKELMPAWLQEIVESYVEDEECQTLMAALALDPQNQPDYSHVGRVLKYKENIVVGKGARAKNKVVKNLHDSTIGGHSGQNNCWQKVKSIFY
ncbi:hypothetical protein ACH5RR_025056 [Cinchona calisaya]|uniref:Reverse transcriptase/retrotransposon-derived protein RNase H-like domain-containing protein n=1 Tax=Cinchona calisaya TaxID=153742 RepID=A0ABD2YYJ0_9GENT